MRVNCRAGPPRRSGPHPDYWAVVTPLDGSRRRTGHPRPSPVGRWWWASPTPVSWPQRAALAS